MRRSASHLLVLLLAASAALMYSANAGADVKKEAVASVNGEKISVLELREALGLVGGGVYASWIALEKKKEALDRLIEVRLLEQSSRARGLDNTEEFRDLMARNEQRMEVNALFRREAASGVSLGKEEVQQEARKLGKKEKNLSATEARARASAIVWEKGLRRIEGEVVAAARKDASATIDEEAIGRIGQAGSLEDNTILGTAGGGAIRYGDVRNVLGRMAGGKHGGGDLSANPVAVRSLVDRELTGMALLAYARKQRAGDPEGLTAVRRETERAVLVNLLTEKVITKKIAVTDREIQDAYARHPGMLVRDGKPIPLSEVMERIRGIVLADKRKAAIDKYVGQLRKKAKIRIYGTLLSKV